MFGINPKVTDGDQLLVRRMRNGETQGQAADRLGVSRRLYGEWERDKVKPPRRAVPDITIFHTHERCLLLRRKAGLTQEDVAHAIGACRYWVNQMEQGKAPVEALREYWGT